MRTVIADTSIELQPIAYRIPDAVRVSGIGKSKLYELEAEGKIKFSRAAGRTLVPRTELQRLIDDGLKAT